MFTGKNQVSVVAAGSITGTTPAWEVQTAYSFVNNLAIMANAKGLSRKAHDNSGDMFKRTHYMAEGGLGFYFKTDRIRFETFGGYGVGQDFSNDFDVDIYPNAALNKYKVRSTYSKIFIQPTIGTAKLDGPVSFFFTTRLSGIHFKEKVAVENPSAFLYRPRKGYSWIIEPSVTATIPIHRNFRIFTQAGASWPLQQVDFQFVPVYFGVGLQLHNIR